MLKIYQQFRKNCLFFSSLSLMGLDLLDKSAEFCVANLAYVLRENAKLRKIIQ